MTTHDVPVGRPCPPPEASGQSGRAPPSEGVTNWPAQARSDEEIALEFATRMRQATRGQFVPDAEWLIVHARWLEGMADRAARYAAIVEAVSSRGAPAPPSPDGKGERAALFAAIDAAIHGLSQDMVDQIANMVESAGFRRPPQAAATGDSRQGILDDSARGRDEAVDKRAMIADAMEGELRRQIADLQQTVKAWKAKEADTYARYCKLTHDAVKLMDELTALRAADDQRGREAGR